MIEHDNISKRKIWGFYTSQAKEDRMNEFEMYEEMFNLKLEVNQLQIEFQNSTEPKERMKLHKKITSHIEALQALQNKLKASSK